MSRRHRLSPPQALLSKRNEHVVDINDPHSIAFLTTESRFIERRKEKGWALVADEVPILLQIAADKRKAREGKGGES